MNGAHDTTGAHVGVEPSESPRFAATVLDALCPRFIFHCTVEESLALLAIEKVCLTTGAFRHLAPLTRDLDFERFPALGAGNATRLAVGLKARAREVILGEIA